MRVAGPVMGRSVDPQSSRSRRGARLSPLGRTSTRIREGGSRRYGPGCMTEAVPAGESPGRESSMGSTRQRSDRPDSARRRQSPTPEALESRQVLSTAVPGYLSLYVPSDLYVTNPITHRRIPTSIRDLVQHNNPNSALLSNQGKIVSGTDRMGNQWTITVHGPGQVIVTDTTPNDGSLDDEINTIQIVGSNPRSTYVTGTVITSNRVLSNSTVLFNRMIALN